MEKPSVPMQQYPNAPQGQPQPPMYAQDAPAPGMPPQQMPGTQYQNAVPLNSLQRSPAPADCPACGQRALTNVSFVAGNTTHAWALGLCCLCCLGCIPYVMSSTKDVEHKCGRCGVLLATYHRSGSTEVHMHS
ncbi:hypothetical protein ACJQWK_04949 [Exserohilum turcicum]